VRCCEAPRSAPARHGASYAQPPPSRRVRPSQGSLDPAVATALQNKITQARTSLAQGKTNEVRDRVRDIRHQLADAAQHPKFTSNPTLDRLLTHLAEQVGATQ
jgi:hypothetical protein